MTGRANSSDEPKPGKPLVAVVGGPLLHTRLDLFEKLQGEFDLVGIGPSAQTGEAFEIRRLPFCQIGLRRGVDVLGDLSAYRELRRIFRSLRPAVVHAFQGKPAVWGRIAARKEKVPVIIGSIEGLGSLYSTHDGSRRMARAFYETLQRSACRGSQLTLFQNQADREHFVARQITTQDKTALTPGLGVRTDFFDPARFAGTPRDALRRELRIPPEAKLTTMVSRIFRAKGVHEFARAADLLRARDPSAHFLLVGAVDGEADGQLDSAELEALGRSVVLAGRRTDVADILAVSDIFVLPTKYREGMPRALLEAMSMALPVVTTDLPGCRDAVKDGESGVIVPPGDAAALAGSISRLLSDEPMRRRMGEAARARVIEGFSLEKVATLTASHYRRLLAAQFGARYDRVVGFLAK